MAWLVVLKAVRTKTKISFLSHLNEQQTQRDGIQMWRMDATEKQGRDCSQRNERMCSLETVTATVRYVEVASSHLAHFHTQAHAHTLAGGLVDAAWRSIPGSGPSSPVLFWDEKVDEFLNVPRVSNLESLSSADKPCNTLRS